jgi:hypothetical protein
MIDLCNPAGASHTTNHAAALHNMTMKSANSTDAHQANQTAALHQQTAHTAAHIHACESRWPSLQPYPGGFNNGGFKNRFTTVVSQFKLAHEHATTLLLGGTSKNPCLRSSCYTAVRKQCTSSYTSTHTCIKRTAYGCTLTQPLLHTCRCACIAP